MLNAPRRDRGRRGNPEKICKNLCDLRASVVEIEGSGILNTMIYKGVARGKIIELEEPLPYPEGQLVSISVDIFKGQPHLGSPVALRQVMHEPPHLRWEDVDGLEREIEEGKLPIHQEGTGIR